MIRGRPQPDAQVQKLYEITIPGLSMKTDFPAVRHRHLADFPQVVEVLAMTAPGTVLVVYLGEDEVDAWLDALSDSVATRRIGLGHSRRPARSLRSLRSRIAVPELRSAPGPA
jgi:hypothetical protein